MIPAPAVLRAVADMIPPALDAPLFVSSFVGMVMTGILLLWWKMHRIGATFGEALAEAQTRAMQPARTAPRVYRSRCIPAVWEDVAPAGYRDDSEAAL